PERHHDLFAIFCGIFRNDGEKRFVTVTDEQVPRAQLCKSGDFQIGRDLHRFRQSKRTKKRRQRYSAPASGVSESSFSPSATRPPIIPISAESASSPLPSVRLRSSL